MEPLTTGAIALLALLFNKTGEKAVEFIVAKAFEQANKVKKLLRDKFIDTANAIEAAAEKAALPPGEPKGIKVAFLLEKVELAAKANQEIRVNLEDLAKDADAAAKTNPELAAAIAALTEVLQAQCSNSQTSAKAEKITIKKQIIRGGRVYQTFGEGDITIHENT